MKLRSLYGWTLLLPLAVPALLALMAQLNLAPSLVRELGIATSYAFLVGGIPYLVLLVGLLIWIRGKTETQIRLAMFVCPLLMAILLGISLFVLELFDPSVPFGTAALGSLGFYAAYAFLFGYAYVLLALVIVWAAKRLGLLAESPSVA